jgi:hypothetical protein
MEFLVHLTKCVSVAVLQGANKRNAWETCTEWNHIRNDSKQSEKGKVGPGRDGYNLRIGTDMLGSGTEIVDVLLLHNINEGFPRCAETPFHCWRAHIN